MTRLLPCLAGALALLATAARGQSVTGASTTQVDVRADNGNDDDGDDDFMVALERAELAASTGDLLLTARVDGVAFAGAPGDLDRADLRLERAALEWSRGDLLLSLGDGSVQLGHGLALSLRRIPEVGLDLTLRGARIELQGSHLAARALLGVVNTANTDPVSLRTVADPRDMVAGGQVQLLPAAGLSLGALLSGVLPGERLLPDVADGTLTAGSFIKAEPFDGAVSAHLEVDVQERWLAGQPSHGAAASGAVLARLGDPVVQVEGLWLSDFEIKGSRNTATNARFDYAEPPTLERADQEVARSREVLGARARVDVPWSSAAVVYASQMVKVGEPRSSTPLVQAHGLVGLELSAGGARWSISSGARAERLGMDKLALVRDLAHLDSDALVPIGGGFEVHSTTTLQLWRTADRPFTRGATALALERRSVGALAVEVGLDTQDPSPEVRHLFLATTVAWQLRPGLMLRVMAGTQRAGVRCLGGVCRQLPSFAGTRAEVVAQF